MSNPDSKSTASGEELLNEHVCTIGLIHAAAEKSLSTDQRLIEGITAGLGRPRTIYFLFGAMLIWGVGNAVAMVTGLRPWDPAPLHWLQGALGLYAAVATTLVLITTTRQQRHAEQRAYLELQVSLTCEKKIAKLIGLVEELRRDIPSVCDRVDLEAENMAHAVDPKAVLTALEETLDNVSLASAAVPPVASTVASTVAPPIAPSSVTKADS